MAPKNAAIRIAGAFFGPGRRKDDYPPGGMRWRGIPGAGPTFRLINNIAVCLYGFRYKTAAANK